MLRLASAGEMCGCRSINLFYRSSLQWLVRLLREATWDLMIKNLANGEVKVTYYRQAADLGMAHYDSSVPKWPGVESAHVSDRIVMNARVAAKLTQIGPSRRWLERRRTRRVRSYS